MTPAKIGTALARAGLVGRRMYQGRLLDRQEPAPRVRLARCADGAPLEMDATLERRGRPHDWRVAVAAGCFAAMLLLLVVASAASWVRSW
ncbi:MAG: hypothetical protein ACRETH_13205 [Steroidobacteraceae bacterium]